MNEETAGFYKLLLIVLTFVGLLWFIFANYGADLVIITLVILAGTVFVIIGAFLTYTIQKTTLSEVSKFAARDALTDRYRMQSMHEMAKAQTFSVKTAENLKLLEAKQTNQSNKLLEAPKDDPLTTFWETSEVLDTDEWN